MNFDYSMFRLPSLDLTNVSPSEKFSEDPSSQNEPSQVDSIHDAPSITFDPQIIKQLGALPIYSVTAPLTRAGGLSQELAQELENWKRLKDLQLDILPNKDVDQ